MKKLFLALVCLFSMGSLMAQTVQVKSSDFGSMQVQLATSTFTVNTVTIANDTFTALGMRDYLPSSALGLPCLPELVKMVEIPVCDGVEVSYRVLRADTLDGSQLGIDHLLMPAQPSRRKSDDSPVQLVMNQQVYSTNAFYGNEVVRVERVGIARDRNLATLYFSPVSYNPVTNQLIVCKSVEATLTYTNANQAATMKMKRIHGSEAFNSAVQTINSLPMPKEVRRTAPVVYQIVAHSMFRNQLDSLIAWKQRKGFIVNVAYTDESNVGTTSTSISAFLQGLYDNATESNPAPTYVLLVGDVEQIPPFTGVADNGHKTDLYFMTWTSGDNIPDCFYGRFSAQNLSQLTPQIEKTLMYERYAFADPSFLQKAVLVSGVDGGYSSDNAYRYGDPTMDYIAKTYLNATNGITTLYYYKNNTNFAPTGVTVTGSSQSSTAASTIRSLYNAGAGWVNYTAHGGDEEWSNPSFNTNHVANMSNSQKFGFMVGNCCQSNTFQTNTCLGEALLRKGNYCGAVAYFGGSDYTYWGEDFYWAVGVRSNINNTCNPTYDANNMGAYDRLFHTHNEAYSEWYTTAGAINMAGCMSVQSSNSSLKDYYWEIYHLMGDPSVMPWIGLANDLTVSANTTLLVGATSMTVNAVPYAYVALTDGNGTLIGAAYADATGVANLSFNALNMPTTSYELAVSAQQYKTSFIPVTVIAPEGPFVLATSVTPQTALMAGHPVSFDVTLKNVGVDPSDSLSLELQTNGNHIYLSDGGIQSINNIAAGDSVTLTAFANGNVWGHVADQTITNLTAIVRWGNHSNEMSTASFAFTVDAPRIVASDMTLDGDVSAGNTIAVAITNDNLGHAPLQSATATLVCPDPCVSVLSSTASLGNVFAEGASVTTNYSIQMANVLPENAIIPLLQFIQGNGVSFCDTLYLQIGSSFTEDFESGDFNSYDWVQNGSYPWQITSSEKYQGTYSARSYTWNNNGANNSSELSITLTSAFDDSISFYQLVSSESGYDFFYFYIDETEMFSKSGTENEWERVAFPVTAGTHTFTFSYQKDYSVNRGSDCAFIDNIVFPRMMPLRDYTIDTVCQGETVTFRGETINTDSLEHGVYYYSDSTSEGLFFLMLTVIGRPELVLDADPDTIRRGESSLITVSGASRYEWNTGEQVSTMRVYPETTTTYVVTGYNGSCAASDSITVYVIGSIGIEESGLPVAIHIYPNPTNGGLQLDNLDVTQPVVICDLYGRTLATYQVDAHQLSIDISHLPNGIYMIRNGKQMAKIIKR